MPTPPMTPVAPHVCILSLAHPPGDGRVTHKIGRAFREAGMKVTWIGPGKEAPAVHHGIDFRLLPVAGGWGNRFKRRKLLLDEARKLDDVGVWFCVEPDSAAMGIRLAAERGGRSVFDIHEVYHDDMLKGRVPRVLQPPLGWIVRQLLTRTCRKSDLIVGAGITRIEPFARVARQSMVVRHCLARAYGDGPAARPFDGTRDAVRILHGKASLMHGTRAVMRAVAHAKRTSPARFRLVMFKSFSTAEQFGLEDAVREARELGIEDSIEWLDTVSFDKMFDLMRGCDAAVIAYSRELGVNSMPNRIFEYMAAGIPTVCPSYARELVSILEETHCGVLVDAEDPRALGDAFVALASDPAGSRAMGGRGRAAFASKFNMEQEIQPLIDWIRTGSR